MHSEGYCSRFCCVCVCVCCNEIREMQVVNVKVKQYKSNNLHFKWSVLYEMLYSHE